MSKPKRFFGLHFDYHANESTSDIGAYFDRTILERIIKEVKPDFIQCDTKGHPGLTSYNTNVGTRAPGIKKDLLREWKDVCKEYGVPLYSHYSGIWDKKATSLHPEWAEMLPDGSLTDRISPYGPYLDKLMIPELKELILDYDMDGAWVDGDAWALLVDYSAAAKEAYKKETGKDIPMPKESGYKDYLSFIRKGFLDYVKKYVDAAHSYKKDFYITSNWLNTAWVPDDVNITDYISGDLSATNSIDSARFEARVMAMSERNWDIMSWAISFPIHHDKSVIQLEQEASCILSLGGGFQIYNIQDPTNVCLNPKAISSWAEISEFCHNREKYCHGGSFVPDLGIYYSVASYYDRLEVPYLRECPYNYELYGTLLGFLDKGSSANIVSEEKLTKEILQSYPRFALSNITKISEEQIAMLLSYASNGGELILLGANTASIFAKSLNLEAELIENDHPIFFIDDDKSSLEVRDSYAKISGKAANTVSIFNPAIVKGDLSCSNPPPTILPSKETCPALMDMPYGKGHIVIVPMNLGQSYLFSRTVEMERLFEKIVSLTKRTIAHNHYGEMDVVLRSFNEKTYLHLINILGDHRVSSISTFDKIPPLVDVDISFRSDKAPKSIRSRPDGENVPFAYSDGTIKIHFERISLYSILEISF